MRVCAGLPPTPVWASARSGNCSGGARVEKGRVAPRSPRDGLPPRRRSAACFTRLTDARPASGRALVCGVVLASCVRLVVLMCLIVGCAGPATPDPQVQERFRTAAAPLLTAHERLDGYARAVADGGDYARARALWPTVADEVGRALEPDIPTVSGLDPAQRATLVGYRGGLRGALAAWERVDAAIRAQQAGAADTIAERAATARDHMRVLDDLRAEAFGVSQ